MLRQALTEGDALGGSGRTAGFEAGAVMGAAQAAWTHLEQRLEAEFDDLGRQLQAMASVIGAGTGPAQARVTRGRLGAAAREQQEARQAEPPGWQALGTMRRLTQTLPRHVGPGFQSTQHSFAWILVNTVRIGPAFFSGTP
jgi:hypothetical protein